MGKGDLIKKIIELNQIKDLNSVQKEAIKKGVLEGKNLVISSPTSSGKTLVAEIAGLNVFLTQKRKMVYLCPLVALAREKYNDFKKKYEKLGIKVALSIGDYDSSDPWLQNYNWIIASLDYDQPILIKISGEVKNLPIGELWDFFSKKKIEKDNKEGYEILDISSFNVKGVVFDPKDYKLKFKKVEKIIRHRVSDPLFEITLQTGRKIKVTLSHSLFVLENLKIKSKPTTEIKEGDYILIPKNLPHSQGTKKNFDLLSEFIKLGIFKNIYVKNLPLRLFKLRKLKKLPLPSYCLKNWKKRKHLPLKVINELKLMKFIPDTAVFGYVGCRSDVPIKIKITPELMRILGYYLAEGSLDLGRYKISFVFNLREKRYVEDLYQCFLKVFNFRPVLTFKKNVIYLEASNKISYSVFERILKVSKGAKNKEIPTLVFNTDKYLKLHFLKAAFRGDGNLNPTAFNYTTSSQKLTSDLLYLLLQMGVVGSVYERKKEQISYIKGRKIRTSGNFQIFINAKKSKEKLKELLRDVPENLVARGFTQPRIEMIPSEQIIPIFEEFWGSRKIKKFIHFGKRLSLYRFRKWALAPGRKIKIEILKFLNSKGKLKCSEIVSFLNKSWGDVNEKLKFLLESELIEREGNLGHYFYSISKKGKELLKNINQIENLFFSDFAFAKVKGIKKIKSKNNYVFDVSVPGYENFVGGIGGVICHNSNEKMDSLIRHGAPWINQIGLIVADEIHLLNDFSRGPTLEILLTLLRELAPQSQILALSATIKNVEELAKWLNAYPLKSDFRPVPLYQGIFLGNKIKVFKTTTLPPPSRPKGGPLIYFL